LTARLQDQYQHASHTSSKSSKPFCASCVVQSAAMSQWLHSAAQLWAMRDVHEVGDRVHHWQTGRRGTVTAVHANGYQIYIKFDLFNPDGWKYGNDGWNEMRRRNCFIVTQKRPLASQSNVDEEAAKRARLQ
jgi:hypothetical protein